MQCPICQIDLMIADRQGIEIDYCPKCRGVWLDRGELDKIIERSASYAPHGNAPEHRSRPDQPVQQGYAPEQRRGHYQPPPPNYHAGSQGHNPHHGAQGHHKRKRESFLEELFDFD